MSDVVHEETADFWRAMHAEEKRKKQSVSAKLSDAIRENERLRAVLVRVCACHEAEETPEGGFACPDCGKTYEPYSAWALGMGSLRALATREVPGSPCGGSCRGECQEPG